MVWGLRALGLELFMRVSRGSEYKCDVSCRRMLLPFRPFRLQQKAGRHGASVPTLSVQRPRRRLASVFKICSKRQRFVTRVSL